MSSLINKVKEKLHSDNKSEQPEGTHGPHSSRAANAADPRIDSDRDHRENLGKHDGSYTAGGDNYSYGADTTTTGTTGTSTLGSSKDTGFGSTATTGPASKTAGMHSSDMANKADPRVDSDLDGSRNMGMRSSGATAGAGTGTTGTTGAFGTSTSGTTGHGSTGTSGLGSTHTSGTTGYGSTGASGLGSTDNTRTTGYGSTGTSGLGSTDNTRTTGYGSTGTSGLGSTDTTGPAPNTAGTHKSDMLNKADPRIDSDLDGSRNMGMRSSGATYGTSSGAGTTGTSGTTMGSGMGSGMGSDTLTGSGATGTYGSSGVHGHHGTHGTHGSSGLGTSSDFSSGQTGTLGSSGQTDTLGSSNTTSAYGGGMGSVAGGFGTDRQATGPAPNTAGPHKSDMLNKADPRVDSDLDNSKTFMGDKTYSQSGSRTTARDPTDAAQVPPSVLRSHIGEPTIEHGDANSDRARRHSVSHQEQHRGL